MKRWNIEDMLAIGQKLFKTIHKKKYYANPNHEVHFLVRELKEKDDWLTTGIRSLINGDYTPRYLKRIYFPDEMIDQLHLSDRILQHILLKQLKPTFPHVMNPNCYHLHGPGGVKLATGRIRQILQEKKPAFLIRADIKSFYKSIPHHQLIQDVNKYYHDEKVRLMLANIITNAIETPRGYKNPDTGIALRGPLSQFFSALYLKPLDDAFDNHQHVDYFRYQDDILILCQTERSLARCKRKMLDILGGRRLSLSRKKTLIGRIDKGFHFLGIHYLGTQPSNNTNVQHLDEKNTLDNINGHCLSSLGGGDKPSVSYASDEQVRIVPHPRTLRKARENVKQMVAGGVSLQRIKNYLSNWVTWWVRTSEKWQYVELLKWYLAVCKDEMCSVLAHSLIYKYKLKDEARHDVEAAIIAQ